MKFAFTLFAVLPILFFSIACYSQENENESEESEDIDNNHTEDQFFLMRNSKSFTSFSLILNTSASSQKLSQQASNLNNVKNVGPYNIGSRTRAFLVDRSNSNNLFAGGVTGGLWKSTDQGISWSAIDDQASNLNVTCIAQGPFNNSIIYYGTGEFVGNHTGVAGTGVFKSIDGGSTFNQLPSTNNSAFLYCQVIKHSLTDSNSVLVGTNKAGVYRSIDDGTSFTNVFSQYINISDVECFPDGSVLIGVSREGIFKSLTGDSGTYIPLTNGLPLSGFSRIELAYCDSFPNIIYSAYGNDTTGFATGLLGVYRSNDSGNSWTQVFNPDSNFNYYFPKLTLCMLVKPDDSSFVLCGGADLAYTQNGGQTWSKVKNIHVDQHSLAFDPYDLTQFYNGNDGGLTRHSIPTITTQVEDINTGYIAQQYYAGAYYPTGINFLAGALDNHTQICHNGDSLFTTVYDLGIDGCFTQVNQQNPDISFASDLAGLIHRSDNSQDSLPNYYLVLNDLDTNGNNQVDDIAWAINPFEINLKDGNQLYYVTTKRVWRSIDGAQNWQPLINPPGDAPFALGISNEIFPTLYIGGDSGLFIRVDNAYNSIPGNEINLSSSLPLTINTDFISCLAVHPDSNSIVYAALSNYSTEPRIWKITNSNTSTPVFTNISGNLPGNLSVTWLEINPLHPDSFFIAATDFGLYTTIDGGLNWQKEMSIPNVSIPNIRLRKGDNKLFIFTHGRGAWVADLNSTGIGIYETSNETGVKVFPNPTSNQVNIVLSSSDIQLNEVVISDMTGRLIRKINYESQNNLTSYSINFSNEAKGIYFVNIKTNKFEVRKKLIKI